MKKQWNYVEKDGNPKMAGLYWVTLIYPERKDGKKTGKFMAEVDTRYFADLDKEPDLRGWTMDGEPDSGFAWIEECGSVWKDRHSMGFNNRKAVRELGFWRWCAINIQWAWHIIFECSGYSSGR